MFTSNLFNVLDITPAFNPIIETLTEYALWELERSSIVDGQINEDNFKSRLDRVIYCVYNLLKYNRGDLMDNIRPEFILKVWSRYKDSILTGVAPELIKRELNGLKSFNCLKRELTH